MSTDILELLKLKEAEMEASIDEARGEAKAIKEEALNKTALIKDRAEEELVKELESWRSREAEALEEEERRILEGAGEKAKVLREMAARRRGEAIELVKKHILGG